ncbi:phage protein Gp36 family protein [Pelotomaculum propionicicum]|uniref:Uncharacterized protein n=1 Tax=Pelotomaculum propionicicum TaxID=258475 RepID=A0A4Y7RJY1_9FIRM|nr:phage protein Gp36 family protein [Pelotomaculum propionicicum]TEB09308.1 hypothetical protein Pmgp_03240 [Pelotomaculum propionicicum]
MYCNAGKVREANELLNDTTIVPDNKIVPFIIKAQERIDTALRERYVVPLREPVPGIIESIAQDMAAGFVLSKSFSNQLNQELLNLSNSLIKRAEADLTELVDKKQLDGLPGISLISTPSASGTPAIASTTPNKSAIEDLIRQW